MKIYSLLPKLLGLKLTSQDASPDPMVFSNTELAHDQRMYTQSGGKPTIQVKRRREGVTGGPQDTERAQAPVRRGRPSQGGSVPPQGGMPQGTSGGGGLGPLSNLPGGVKGLPIGCVVLLIIGYLVINLLSGGQPEAETPSDYSQLQEPATQEPFVAESPTKAPPTARPTSTRSASTNVSGQTWTVMLYQDADDQILEQDIYLDLNEVEKVGSTENVQIVAQLDRYRGAYSGDGNWTSTRRYYVTQDNDLQKINSEMVADLGEVNMADGNSLVDFITWAVGAYPADKYVLILSDHGMGWPGGWSDPAPGGRDSSRAPIASALSSDEIFLMELDKALETARQQTGVDKFEMIGMDACLMAHIEVLTALEPYAHYAVVSQETEPALGWAYSSFLEKLVANPDMDGAELGGLIVDSYIQDDQRIVDDQARADLLKQGSPLGGLFGSFGGPTADQLAQQMERNATMSAIDLSVIPDLNQSLNNLAYALQSEDQSVVARAREYAQSFTSVFGRDIPPSYIDLGNFIQLLKSNSRNLDVAQAVNAMLKMLDKAVIAEKHGSGKPGATGISIYFPNSTLYSSPITGAQSYVAVAQRFAETSSWDDFLAFHYYDRSFERVTSLPVVPGPTDTMRAPGGGQIEISQVTLSSQEAAPGQPVTLDADVTGQNIGYIYLFLGYYDQASNSIFVADTDYLESPDTRQIEGVYYPVWNEDQPFTVELDWEPTVFAINDGTSDPVLALFTPESYGASAQDAVYTVDGTYTYASGGTCYARLYFRDGSLRQVFGFNSQDATGSPGEIIPTTGDTFTILEKWIDLDASGQSAQTTSQEGATLTFGDQMFQMQELYAAPGDYIIGIIVEDLDGNTQEAYAQVTVR